MPDWLRCPTDLVCKERGRYDPAVGRGRPEEEDSGNMAGSALLLAMLLPAQFGVPGAPCLEILGVPVPSVLTFVSQRRPKSGAGVDNRRANVIEGLLNDWQHVAAESELGMLRRGLLQTWKAMRLAVDAIDDGEKRVYEIVRPCLQVDDAHVRAACLPVPVVDLAPCASSLLVCCLPRLSHFRLLEGDGCCSFFFFLRNAK